MAVFEAVSSALQHLEPPPSGDILWYKAHGFLMWLSFSILFPLGILGVRYSLNYRRVSCWFQYHWVVQVSGVLLSTTGLSIALRRFGDCRASLHGQMGMTLVFIVLLQPMLAVFRPALGTHLRSCWVFSHWFLGTLSVILGWVNIFQGLDWFFVKWPGTVPQTLLLWLFSGQVSLWVFCYLVMVRCPDSDCDYSSSKLLKPLLGDKQFLVNV